MNATAELDRLFDKLSKDDWRRSNPFQPDLCEAQEELWRSDLPDNQKAAVLNRWLLLRQPCFFARFAARHGLLCYTFVTEEEIRDDLVGAAKRIHAAQEEVGRSFFEGRSMGWVLVLVSRTLALAAPDGSARRLAAKLFDLLLRDTRLASDGTTNLELDRIWLRDRNDPLRPLCWESPYNFFSAQADGRFWKARRFPSGWAFSLNSVGHSVAANLLTPNAGLKWAQGTMIRTPGVQLSPRASAYTCDYDTDALLPEEFFAKMQARQRGPFAFTALFDRTERSAPVSEWSEDAARRDGRGFRTDLSDVWFL